MINPQELKEQSAYFGAKNAGYRLHKKVLRVSGNAASLILGLTTNFLEAPLNAFLDRQGKLIALVDQFFISPSEIYLAVAASYEEPLIRHLASYLPYSEAQLSSTDLSVFHISGKQINGKKSIAKSQGYYLLSENSQLPAGFEIWPDSYYEMVRIENDIPLQGIDFDRPMFLETGLLEGVSFTKGCYLGQEIIARVYHLGKPKKQLVRILYEKIPSDVTVDGNYAGEITSQTFSVRYQKFLVFAMRENENEVDAGEILKPKDSIQI